MGFRHPVAVWPSVRKKVHVWGSSSRYSRGLEKFAQNLGQIVAKQYRVSHRFGANGVPGFSDDEDDEDDDDEWSHFYEAPAESEAGIVETTTAADGVVPPIEAQSRSSNIGSKIGVLVVVLACFLHSHELLVAGIITFTVSLVFVFLRLLDRRTGQPRTEIGVVSFLECKSADSSNPLKSRRKSKQKSRFLASIPDNLVLSERTTPYESTRTLDSLAPPSVKHSDASRQVSIVAAMLVVVLVNLQVLGMFPAVLAASFSWFILAKLDRLCGPRNTQAETRGERCNKNDSQDRTDASRSSTK